MSEYIFEIYRVFGTFILDRFKPGTPNTAGNMATQQKNMVIVSSHPELNEYPSNDNQVGGSLSELLSGFVLKHLGHNV
jgi:hypothetical protein